jgi:hypothetical protein
MPVKLTLSMFSGRPNPSLMLDDAAARNLFKKLSLGVLKKQTLKTTPFPSVLGYRGLIIEQQGKKLNADMPQLLHYVHDMVYTDGKAAKAAGGLESFLFDNFEKLQDVKDLADFRRTTEMQLKEYLDKRQMYIDNYFRNIDLFRDDVIILRPVCPCAPAPDLAAWNTDFSIQDSNNCYNYGTNYRTDTFAQPGNASGQHWTSNAGCDLPAPGISAKKGATLDGLIDKPNQDNKCISPGHLVALVNGPDYDYHWFRKGPNGRWSHKPGHTPATLLDNSGNPITDPRTADRGPYTNFCTFMQVIHGRFKIK